LEIIDPHADFIISQYAQLLELPKEKTVSRTEVLGYCYFQRRPLNSWTQISGKNDPMRPKFSPATIEIDDSKAKKHMASRRETRIYNWKSSLNAGNLIGRPNYGQTTGSRKYEPLTW
jgi:hypothetical protein